MSGQSSPRAVPGTGTRPFARTLLRVSVLALCILLLLLGAGAYWSYRQHFAEAKTTNEAVTRLLAHQTARALEATDLALVQLVRLAEEIDWTVPANVLGVKRELLLLKHRLPFVSRVFILGPDGRPRLSTIGEAATAIDASNREYFQDMREGRTGLFVSSMSALSDGAQVLVLARAIRGNRGAFGGAAVISFVTEDLEEFFASLSAPYASIMRLLDLEGRTVLRSPSTVQVPLSSLDPALETALSISRSEGIATGSVTGATRYWSFQRVGAFPTTVAVGASLSAMHKAWLGYIAPYGAFVLSALIALASLMWVAWRQAGAEDRYRQRLSETNADLERRVATRTVDLETANERLRGALAERDVLLREIHHRVKNNMQVIASLLSIQSNSVNRELRPYFQDNMQRIRAMARIHESLYASDNLAQVDFAAYLASLCEDLRSSFGARDRVVCTIEAPPLSFPIDVATPLGLLLNEVISNSLKHGFSDNGRGRIDITIRLNGSEITFLVQDDGAGLPPDLDLATDRSMGLRLIRILAQQLGATYVFERPPEGGALFRLLLPSDPSSR